MKKRVKTVFVLLFVVSLIVGCGPAPTPTATPEPQAPTAAPPVAETLPIGPERFTKEFAGEEVSVLCLQSSTVEAVQKLLPEFEEMTGIKVNYEITPHEQAHQKAVLDLSGGTASYDVIMIDQPFKPEFDQMGQSLPLDDFIAKEDPYYMDDFVQRVVEIHGRTEDGSLIAVPFMHGVQLLAYRKDLFEQEADNFKAATGKELKPPETWEEFIEVAKFFSKEYNPDSPTDYGAALYGSKGHMAYSMLAAVLWGTGAREFNEQYEVTINDEKGLYAWELLNEMAKYGQPDSAAHGFDETSRFVKTGKAAMTFQWDSLNVALELPDSDVRGKLGYDIIPGGAPQYGGFALTINKNSPKQEAAWEFVRWATGPEYAKKVSELGGLPARVSVMDDPETEKRIPFIKAVKANLEIGQARGSACPDCMPIIPETELETIMGTEASAMLAGQKTPQEAADAAAAGIEEMLERWGYAK